MRKSERVVEAAGRAVTVTEYAPAVDTGQTAFLCHGKLLAPGGHRSFPTLAAMFAEAGYRVVVPGFVDTTAPGGEQFNVRRMNELAEIIKYYDSPESVVLGHSAGAQTALSAIGATYDGARWWNDERVRCAVILSPQGLDDSSQTTADTWATLERPVLYGTGTLDDGGRTGDPWYWRLEPQRFGTTEPRATYVVEGADHRDVGMAHKEIYSIRLAERVIDYCNLPDLSGVFFLGREAK
jgi:pimeloyl-ACP methyl ester carboxylesterase